MMIDKNATGRRDRRRKAAGAILDGIESDGVPGLITAVGRMIGENQPSMDCLLEAEDSFGPGAPSGGSGSEIDAEEVWDSALDLAACLREAILDPEPPEPPEPPEDPPEPPPPPPHDWRDHMSEVVLAALLVRLHKEGPKRAR